MSCLFLSCLWEGEMGYLKNTGPTGGVEHWECPGGGIERTTTACRSRKICLLFTYMPYLNHSINSSLLCHQTTYVHAYTYIHLLLLEKAAAYAILYRYAKLLYMLLRSYINLTLLLTCTQTIACLFMSILSG